MKKQIFAYVLALISSTATISNSFAQTAAVSNQSEAIAKTSFDLSTSSFNNTDDAPPASTALSITAVSPKAVKSFDKSFKEVTSPVWYAVNKNSYLATFTDKDGRSSRALFAKNGYIHYTINYGTEKNLPKEARRLIKSYYVDYNIGRVSEVSVDLQKVWIVNLQDDENIVIARVTSDGTIDELAQYPTKLKEKKHRKGSISFPQNNKQ